MIKRKFHSKPEALDSILSGTLSAYRIKDKLRAYDIFLDWAETVGEETAKVAWPKKIIKKRILVLQTLNSSWAQEIELMKQDLINKISAKHPQSVIEEIKIVTGDPTKKP